MLRHKRQSWQRRVSRFIPYICSGLILAILPFFLPTYLESMMTKVLIYGIFAMSLDFIFGYTGLVSLGHAAYLGVAGYVTGILVVQYGVKSFFLAAPAGLLAATFVAAIFGIIALQVSGMYFLLITFALGELLFSAAMKWTTMTGGSYGFAGIPYPDLGLSMFAWGATSFYYFCLVAFVICFLLLHRVVNSPFGYALQGIRQDEPRMRCLGYNTWLFKYIAFVVSGLFAGVAGVLFAHFSGLMAPIHLGIYTSSLVLLMVILGGAGTLWGPVIGSLVVTFVEFYASIFAAQRWPLILGTVFVVTVMFLKGGTAVYLSNLFKKVRKEYGNTEG